MGLVAFRLRARHDINLIFSPSVCYFPRLSNGAACQLCSSHIPTRLKPPNQNQHSIVLSSARPGISAAYRSAQSHWRLWVLCFI